MKKDTKKKILICLALIVALFWIVCAVINVINMINAPTFEPTMVVGLLFYITLAFIMLFIAFVLKIDN